MRLALGRPRAALVVAPHPDDEVIGAFGLITALLAAGTKVRVLVVTDGAASHTNSALWPRARLAARRRQESRRALRRLGLAADRVQGLDLPDGGLARVQPCLDLAIAREVRRRPGLDLLIGPVDDDDHADHRAVAAALVRVRTRARRLAYPVWPEGSGRTCPLRLPVRGGAAAKRSALRVHRSQWSGVPDDPDGFALTPRQFAAFTLGVERFRRVRR